MQVIENQLKILQERVDHFGWLFDKNPNSFLDDETRRAYRGVGVSKSSLDRINKSMDHYFGPKDVETPAMRIGSAFHKLSLEVENFDEEYFLAPKVDKRSSEGKKRFALAEQENPGKIGISPLEWDMIHQMAESVHFHPLARDLLSVGSAEQTMMWNDKQTDVLMKGRIDWCNKDYMTVIDLKSTADASLDKIERDVWNTEYRYNVQAAVYTDGIRAIYGSNVWDFHFIFVEKKVPFGVQVIHLDETGIAIGREQYLKNVNQLINWFERAVESLNKNEYLFSGYSDEAIEVKPPVWLIQKFLKKKK